jgi:ribosome-binding protein aMBF1 (putative translation factor)
MSQHVLFAMERPGPRSYDPAVARPARKPRDPELVREFGRRLRAARQDKGWSLTDMWFACGISATELSRFERGGREPRLTTLIVLAETLDVPPGELLEGLSTRP